jgi:hypothetical protein
MLANEIGGDLTFTKRMARGYWRGNSVEGSARRDPGG